MAANHFECISEVSSTNADFETIETTSTDDEWDVCTNDGFEDEVPMPNYELSRIRTGDLDSLPLQHSMLATPATFVTCGPDWQLVMMMPSYGMAVNSAVAFQQPCGSLIDAPADSRSICDMVSGISKPQKVAPQTQSPLDLLLRLASVSSNGEHTTSEASADSEPLCGNGRCRPCYDHIRGKCTKGDACTYCHAAIHAIRRKQRKHQRRAQAFKENLVEQLDIVDSCVKTTCCNGKCQPCFRHMRGTCALGAECAYCHDLVHARGHTQRIKA